MPATLLLIGLLTACAADSAGPSAEPTVKESPTEEPTATPAVDGAPADLAGTWRRSVRGEVVLLTLRDTGYRIRRGEEMGSGHISVDGDAITLSGSSRCDGVGRYTWAIVDDRLHFTEIDDPCSGRTDVLLFGTFGRVDE